MKLKTTLLKLELWDVELVVCLLQWLRCMRSWSLPPVWSGMHGLCWSCSTKRRSLIFVCIEVSCVALWCLIARIVKIVTAVSRRMYRAFGELCQGFETARKRLEANDNCG